MKFLFPLFISAVSLVSLNSDTAAKTMQSVSQTANLNTSVYSNGNHSSKIVTSETSKDSENETARTQTERPKTVRDFFNLMPQKYFTLERCVDKPTKNNCDKARAEYLKNYLEIEDTANGYMKGSCDGAQSCFTMALFKRPNGTYIVAINKLFEMGEETHFLEYSSGKWKDIGLKIIPEYSKEKTYELPRKGTTIEVYELREMKKDSLNAARNLRYSLANGNFSIKNRRL
jgi:hypothetical protein